MVGELLRLQRLQGVYRASLVAQKRLLQGWVDAAEAGLDRVVAAVRWQCSGKGICKV